MFCTGALARRLASWQKTRFSLYEAGSEQRGYKRTLNSEKARLRRALLPALFSSPSPQSCACKASTGGQAAGGVRALCSGPQPAPASVLAERVGLLSQAQRAAAARQQKLHDAGAVHGAVQHSATRRNSACTQRTRLTPWLCDSQSESPIWCTSCTAGTHTQGRLGWHSAGWCGPGRQGDWPLAPSRQGGFAQAARARSLRCAPNHVRQRTRSPTKAPTMMVPM